MGKWPREQVKVGKSGRKWAKEDESGREWIRVGDKVDKKLGKNV